MSFAVYPQPDACKAWMPTTPLPPSMSPPSPPMVCHMPAGHDGPHSIERRPTTLSRRWEGDARPPKVEAPAVTDARVRPADSDEPATAAERSALMIDGLWDDSDYPEHSHADVLRAYRLGYEDGSR